MSSIPDIPNYTLSAAAAVTEIGRRLTRQRGWSAQPPGADRRAGAGNRIKPVVWLADRRTRYRIAGHVDRLRRVAGLNIARKQAAQKRFVPKGAIPTTGPSGCAPQPDPPGVAGSARYRSTTARNGMTRPFLVSDPPNRSQGCPFRVRILSGCRPAVAWGCWWRQPAQMA
jgi:hypothetical protein